MKLFWRGTKYRERKKKVKGVSLLLIPTSDTKLLFYAVFFSRIECKTMRKKITRRVNSVVIINLYLFYVFTSSFDCNFMVKSTKITVQLESSVPCCETCKYKHDCHRNSV